MTRLRGCFYALSRFERRVLVLRAGLGGRVPRSVRQVARRVDAGVGRVRRAERSALRQLRAADRSHGCGSTRVVALREDAAAVMVAALADSPRLTQVATIADRQPVGAGAKADNDGGEVLGASGSYGRGGSAPARSGLTPAAAADTPGEGFDGRVWLATAALLLSALASWFLLLRRPVAESAEKAQEAPPAARAPSEEPARDAAPEPREHRTAAAEAIPAAPWDDLAPPPGPEERAEPGQGAEAAAPPPSPQPEPPQPAREAPWAGDGASPSAHGRQRRPLGLAASAGASLLVGRLMRRWLQSRSGGRR